MVLIKSKIFAGPQRRIKTRCAALHCQVFSYPLCCSGPAAGIFSRSLITLGFGVWLAHYGFHFFTGFLTVIPVSQYAAADALGWPLLGEPLWRLGGFSARVAWPLEVGFLALGLLGSWLVAWSIAGEFSPHRGGRVFLPWAVTHLALFLSALWIMNQPMDMRGTFLGG